MKPEKWAMVPFSIIKTHIKLISSLLMYKSVLLLSHQQFISVYDLRYYKWVQTIDFTKDVQRIILTTGDKIMVGLNDASWLNMIEMDSASGVDMSFKID